MLRPAFYVSRWSPEKVGDSMAGAEAVAAEIGLRLPMPPASLIGVKYLFEPDVLVAVEGCPQLNGREVLPNRNLGAAQRLPGRTRPVLFTPVRMGVTSSVVMCSRPPMVSLRKW